MQTLKLVQALGLKPLDRLQLNSARFMREQELDRTRNPLPYWFFQRVRSDGLWEVVSAGGSIENVEPTEVSDFIEGIRFEVRAITQATFIQRLSMPLRERQGSPPDSAYAPAYVRYVRKDRWNRIDQVYVQFHSDSLNGSPTFASPIHPDDRTRLGNVGTRRNMPIAGPGTARLSVDDDVQRIEHFARYSANAFICAAMAGNNQAVEALSQVGLRPLTTSKINRLLRT